MKKKIGICFLAAGMSAMACDCNDYQSKDGCPAPVYSSAYNMTVLDMAAALGVFLVAGFLCFRVGDCQMIWE